MPQTSKAELQERQPASPQLAGLTLNSHIDANAARTTTATTAPELIVNRKLSRLLDLASFHNSARVGGAVGSGGRI
jgi:hypothetical protein